MLNTAIINGVEIHTDDVIDIYYAWDEPGYPTHLDITIGAIQDCHIEICRVTSCPRSIYLSTNDGMMVCLTNAVKKIVVKTSNGPDLTNVNKVTEI